MSVYAIADLHGRYDLFQMVKDFIKPEDTVYMIGDCADRGPDGWKILKEVYDNPQFIYLKGNHEDMLASAMLGEKRLCFYNGGENTYRDWKKEPNRGDWFQKINELPVHLTYFNKRGQKVELTHAGYTPHINQWNWDEDLYWSRDHFNDEWDENFPDTIIVHGHTPIPYIGHYLYLSPRDEKVAPCAFWYCKDKKGRQHKLDIDCGAFFTGLTVLVDLDTWEQYTFRAEDCVYED